MKISFMLIAIGIISTLMMDLGGTVLRKSRLTAGAPPQLVGKWLQSAVNGNVFVSDIRTCPGEPVPLGRFLLYHYIIGTLLTFIFYLIIFLFRVDGISWWMPLLYGLATTLIPLFLMFPGMGFGIAGLKGPTEFLLLRTAVLNHFLFGIGLTLTFKWFQLLH